MTDKKINEAMAKLDGWTSEEVTEHNSFPYGGTATFTRWTSPTGVRSLGTRTFSYTTDHNACQRVIDGIEDLEAYWFSLYLVVGANNSLLRATPRQKCGAILKAKGLWQKD